jgi:hypothetical protein
MTSSCSLGAVAFKVLPRVAVGAIDICFAFCGRVILFNHVADHFEDFVGADADAPAKVFDGVVDAFLACVAHTLHGVAADCAHAGRLVALSHVYGICSVAKVEATSKLSFL